MAEAARDPGAESADPAKSGRSHVRPPPPPRPPRPDLSILCCPEQPTFLSIQVHVFDIARGTCGYVGTLDVVMRRRNRLSPFTVNGIPVTPLINPKTGFSSHFIIRLIDSRKPRYEADLLFRDTDMYFVGFRRNLVLTEDEIAEVEREKQQEEELKRKEQEAGSSKKKMTSKEKKVEELKNKKKKQVAGWGQWYRFKDLDMLLPDFFEAESCGVSAGYVEENYATLGGPEVFEHMLETFGTFQDGHVSRSQLLTAAYRVMLMFCEAVRLRSVWKLVTKRLVEETSPCEIPDDMWELVRDWDTLGTPVLQARVQGTLNHNSALPSTIVDYHPKLKTYGDLIGENGELRLINRDEQHMGYTETELKDMRAQAKMGVQLAEDQKFGFIHDH
ncbi:hypothetical protein EJB05_10821 [Eragrostis curvula]|uniref:Uncharacterized protein n=1 Tax=Eragrostis curvula TaxID=38414 RepID=A0A5J9VPU1_9POAL|nr:hypothetical protein EJB05_10821 [Eragrostis curvula]